MASTALSLGRYVIEMEISGDVATTPRLRRLT